MKFTTGLVAILTCCGFTMTGWGDVLELKNGTLLNGTYAGGSADTVRFTTDAGTQVIQTSQIVALTFTSAKAAAGNATPKANEPAGAAAPVVQAQPQSVPAGTVLMVRTMDSISSKNASGTPFTTKLETDAGPIKAGTIIYGRIESSTQARRAVGRSTLDLRLTQVVVNGQPSPIMTSGYQEAGKASGGKAARGAAAGAAIGAIAGDAGKGAAIGATGGALVRGETVTIPPGTLLQFTLLQPANVQATP